MISIVVLWLRYNDGLERYSMLGNIATLLVNADADCEKISGYLKIFNNFYDSLWLILAGFQKVHDYEKLEHMSQQITTVLKHYPILNSGGIFAPSSHCFFLVVNPSEKKTFVSNQLGFDSNFITITPKNLKKVKGSFPTFEISRNHFQNLSIFWPILNLKDVIRRFCDVPNST